MEILETVPVYALRTWAAILLGILGFSAFIVPLIFWVEDSRYASRITICLISAFVIFVTLCITGIFSDFGGYEHTIRFDPGTPVSKLYEKYKVKDHEKYSNVFTVREYLNSNP